MILAVEREGSAWALRSVPEISGGMVAEEVATHARALPAAAIALAERSLVAMQHEDWEQAAFLAEQAQGVVRAGRLDIAFAAMPSRPTLSWMPFSRSSPTFSIQSQASTPWNCAPSKS